MYLYEYLNIICLIIKIFVNVWEVIVGEYIWIVFIYLVVVLC